MPSTHVVEVQVIEIANVRTGPYNRGGVRWQPGLTEAVVDDALLELLTADKWLKVKQIDAAHQAAKKQGFALAARLEADQAEATAKELRARADVLTADAEEAFKAAGSLPPTAPLPAPTPYTDAIKAATPGEGTEAETLAAAAEATRPSIAKPAATKAKS